MSGAILALHSGATVQDYVTQQVQAHLSASYESKLGNHLQSAIGEILSLRYLSVRKDPCSGVDFVFEDEGENLRFANGIVNPVYLLQLKSGTSWGNGSQWSQQYTDFKLARKKYGDKSYCVLGALFNKSKSSLLKYGLGHYLVGEHLWDFLTGHTRVLREALGATSREAVLPSILISPKDNAPTSWEQVFSLCA